MANIKKLKANGQDIVPITHEQAVLDSNGVTLESKLATINNTLSRLENNSTPSIPSTPDTPSTPSLEGNIKILTIGNYTITYNETDDTLDFLYNGATDEPVVPPTTEEEVVPLVWAVGNLDSSGSETEQSSTLRSGFVTIEDNYDYSFYLDTSMLDPTGIRVYFYDSNKTFISRTSGSELGYTTGTDIPIDIPSNATYMRFKANASGTTSVDTIGTLFTLRKTISYGEVVSVTWIDNRNINIQGVENDDTSAMVTDYLTKEDGYNYTINLTSVSSVKIYFFNNSRTFISRTNNLTVDSTDTLIEFPENTVYFRIKSDKGTATVANANDYIIIKKVKKANGYVTNGLSLYIDAQDVTTQGSVRDITGKQSIVNHGVSTTLDNNCLNFVASESDYLDTGFKPNLTKWSAEAYFYFTTTPTSAETLLGWGASGNRTAIASWGASFMIAINGNVEHTIISAPPTSLTHLVLTYNNGTIIAYVNGAKSQIATNANVMSSQAGNLMIGTKYNATSEFGNIHVKSLRFYDGKVLTDEEASQNYNYETNRNDEVVSVTWIDNMKLDTNTGSETAADKNACSNFISYDNSYEYTLAINSVTFFRVYYYDSSQSYIKNDNIADNFNGMINPPENTAYMRLKLNKQTVEFADLNNHVILRKTHK